MATYIEITSDSLGALVEYNQLAPLAKMKRAYLTKKALLSLSLSSDESFIEIQTGFHTYQFSYVVAGSQFAMIEIVNGVTITSNAQLFDVLKSLV